MDNEVMVLAGIEFPERSLAEFCRKHRVKELMLFGSAARGELRQDSDVDFLVDFVEGEEPGLLEFQAMRRELEALVGRRVDLAVKPALKPLLREEVLGQARLLYAA